MRLTRIYTRTGDAGETALANGERLPKDAPRIEAMGSVDELNSLIGLLRSALDPEAAPAATLDEPLQDIQQRLFDLGGELALVDRPLLTPAAVTQLERWLDDLNAQLPPLQEFVLPGGTPAAANCHLARAVCRRAERDLVRLGRTETVNPVSLTFINRLSDFLFVAARVLARSASAVEPLWQKPEPQA